jgi:carboxymethylenebutenolidase
VTPPPETAGSAYLVHPHEGPGPGVLLLHSWWGLTPFFKDLANRLADNGYTVLVPDLLEGKLPATPDEAESMLAEADVNKGAALVLSSARALRAASLDARAPIAVLGFSMGASWGLWLSARSPLEVAATVVFYGTQSIDFGEAVSSYLGHFAEFDALVPDDEVVELEAHLRMLGRDVTFWRYPGTSHWFFESDRELAFVPEAAEVAWQRTLEFLQQHVPKAEP